MFLRPEQDLKKHITKQNHDVDERNVKRSPPKSKPRKCKIEILHSYKKGDNVWYRTNSPQLAKWIPATIISKLSPLVYKIKLERGNIRKAHLSQMKDKVERKLPNYFPIPFNPNKRRRSESCSPIASRTRSRLLRNN